MRKKTVYIIPDNCVSRSMTKVIGTDWNGILASDWSEEFMNAATFEDLDLFYGKSGVYSNVDDSVTIAVNFDQNKVTIISNKKDVKLTIKSKNEIDEDTIEYTVLGIVSSDDLLEEFKESFVESEPEFEYEYKTPSPSSNYFSPAHSNYSPDYKNWSRKY